MSQSIQVIANRVDKNNTATGRQIAARAQELADYARTGYDLAHTATIDGDDHVTFVDTLTRTHN